jgi:ribosomal protein L32E
MAYLFAQAESEKQKKLLEKPMAKKKHERKAYRKIMWRQQRVAALWRNQRKHGGMKAAASGAKNGVMAWHHET